MSQTERMDVGPDSSNGSVHDNSAKGLLTLIHKGRAIKELCLYDGDNVIGRLDDCNIRIFGSQKLSGRHACINVRADYNREVFYIKNIKNLNRTKIKTTANERHVLKQDAPLRLESGDTISFGNVKCRFRKLGMDERKQYPSRPAFQSAELPENNSPARLHPRNEAENDVGDEGASLMSSDSILQATANSNLSQARVPSTDFDDDEIPASQPLSSFGPTPPRHMANVRRRSFVEETPETPASALVYEALDETTVVPATPTAPNTDPTPEESQTTHPTPRRSRVFPSFHVPEFLLGLNLPPPPPSVLDLPPITSSRSPRGKTRGEVLAELERENYEEYLKEKRAERRGRKRKAEADEGDVRDYSKIQFQIPDYMVIPESPRKKRAREEEDPHIRELMEAMDDSIPSIGSPASQRLRDVDEELEAQQSSQGSNVGGPSVASTPARPRQEPKSSSDSDSESPNNETPPMKEVSVVINRVEIGESSGIQNGNPFLGLETGKKLGVRGFRKSVGLKTKLLKAGKFRAHNSKSNGWAKGLKRLQNDDSSGDEASGEDSEIQAGPEEMDKAVEEKGIKLLENGYKNDSLEIPGKLDQPGPSGHVGASGKDMKDSLRKARKDSESKDSGEESDRKTEKKRMLREESDEDSDNQVGSDRNEKASGETGKKLRDKSDKKTEQKRMLCEEPEDSDSQVGSKEIEKATGQTDKKVLENGHQSGSGNQPGPSGKDKKHLRRSTRKHDIEESGEESDKETGKMTGKKRKLRGSGQKVSGKFSGPSGKKGGDLRNTRRQKSPDGDELPSESERKRSKRLENTEDSDGSVSLRSRSKPAKNDRLKVMPLGKDQKMLRTLLKSQVPPMGLNQPGPSNAQASSSVKTRKKGQVTNGGSGEVKADGMEVNKVRETRGTSQKIVPAKESDQPGPSNAQASGSAKFRKKDQMTSEGSGEVKNDGLEVNKARETRGTSKRIVPPLSLDQPGPSNAQASNSAKSGKKDQVVITPVVKVERVEGNHESDGAKMKAGRPKTQLVVVKKERSDEEESSKDERPGSSKKIQPKGKAGPRTQAKVKKEAGGEGSRDVGNKPGKVAVKPEPQGSPVAPSISKVAICGMEKKRQKMAGIITNLGGTLLDSSQMFDQRCQVLIADQLSATPEVLCAVSMGIPIVGHDWLDRSARYKQFVNPWPHIVPSAAFQRRYDFELEDSLVRAQSLNAGDVKLLHDIHFYVQEGISEPPATRFNEFLKPMGATASICDPKVKLPREPNCVFVVKSKKDKLGIRGLTKRVTVDELVAAILHQDADLLPKTLSA